MVNKPTMGDTTQREPRSRLLTHPVQTIAFGIIVSWLATGAVVVAVAATLAAISTAIGK